jgi:hypothetical protein
MKTDLAQFHAAAKEAKAALEACLDRLHLNNMNGEEDQWIVDVEVALTMLNSLPINDAEAKAHVWPDGVQERIKALIAELEDEA